MESTQWMIGAVTDSFGPGSFGVGLGSKGAIQDGAKELQVYEAHYTFPINDGMEAQAGIYSLENDGTDNEVGVVMTTTFSF